MLLSKESLPAIMTSTSAVAIAIADSASGCIINKLTSPTIESGNIIINTLILLKLL